MHTSADQWAPTMYKTSRRPSLVSKFAVVAEKSSRMSTLHCENGGAEDVSGGTTVLGRKIRFLGNQDEFQDHLSCQEDLRSCSTTLHQDPASSDFFYFFPCVARNKKNNLKYHVLPDLEVKWQYYHHQIRGKCSPEQVLESPYSAWLVNASSSRLTNCS